MLSIVNFFTSIISKPVVLAVGSEIAKAVGMIGSPAGQAVVSGVSGIVPGVTSSQPSSIKTGIATFVKNAIDDLKGGISQDKLNKILSVLNEIQEVIGVSATIVHQLADSGKTMPQLEGALIAWVNGDETPQSYKNLTVSTSTAATAITASQPGVTQAAQPVNVEVDTTGQAKPQV